MEGRTPFRHASLFVAHSGRHSSSCGKVAFFGRSLGLIDRSMGKKGSTGASAGRLGGRLAAGKKLKNKLKRLPAVKVINKAEKKRRKKRKEQTAAAAAAQVVSASLMAIADSIADALNLTPSHKDLVLLGASAAYTAHQAIVQEAASVSGSTASTIRRPRRVQHTGRGQATAA